MVHIVLSIVLAVLFVATGTGKVLGLGYADRQREALHVSPTLWRVAGILEWLGAVGLIVGMWVPLLGVLAASGLALFMAAAAVSRLRASRLSGSRRGMAIGFVGDIVFALVAAVTAALIARGV